MGFLFLIWHGLYLALERKGRERERNDAMMDLEMGFPGILHHHLTPFFVERKTEHFVFKD